MYGGSCLWPALMGDAKWQRLGYSEKVLPPEGGWVLKQAPQGASLAPTLPELKEHLDNSFRHMVELFGSNSCSAPGVGLNPWESLPTQDIL